MTTDYMPTIITVAMRDMEVDQDWNCRGVIRPIDVIDLAKDIERQGLQSPVAVTEGTKPGKYKLCAGFRRFTAHQLLERETILAIYRPELTDNRKATIFNLTENIHRSDLNILQEARGISHLRDLGMGEEDTGLEIGRSRGWVQVRFMLLKLPQAVQEAAGRGELTQTNIRKIFTLKGRGGSDADLIVAAKKIKDAKSAGRKVRNKDVNITPVDAKKPRGRTDIFAMMEHMQQYFASGLWARCLAWAAGQISDVELDESAAEYAAASGQRYVQHPRVAATKVEEDARTSLAG